MQYTPSIFLIGLMGAGKSSVGRKLSDKLSRAFYDVDYELEQRTGATINLIFEIEGELGFRKRESQLLEELTAIPNIVLATGGGAVLSEANRAVLVQRGFVVYLKSSIDDLIKKISRDNKRPLLRTAEPATVLKKLLVERGPLYLEVADLVVDTDGLSMNDIALCIMSASQ